MVHLWCYNWVLYISYPGEFSFSRISSQDERSGWSDEMHSYRMLTTGVFHCVWHKQLIQFKTLTVSFFLYICFVCFLSWFSYLEGLSSPIFFFCDLNRVSLTKPYIALFLFISLSLCMISGEAISKHSSFSQ